MMLHQNFKQINMKDSFVAAEFPKTPSPKPARIPPQTPPAGGKSAEAGRIHSPRQIVSPCRVRISSFNRLDFARNSFELCPTNTALFRVSEKGSKVLQPSRVRISYPLLSSRRSFSEVGFVKESRVPGLPCNANYYGQGISPSPPEMWYSIRI